MKKTLKAIQHRGMVVGMTCASLTDFAALFANGIGQNAIYLALLLQRIPSVKRVILFVPASEVQPTWITSTFGIEVLPHTTGIVEVDVLIELGWRVDAELASVLRARGGRLVSYVGGNQMVMNLEAVACKLPRGEMMSAAGFDGVWMTPQHWRTNLAYTLLTRDAPVWCVPQIWDPICLRMAQHGRADLLSYKPSTRPQREAKRIGVFDPNVNVLKTFHIPALVCEEAFRQQPAQVEKVLLFCTEHLKAYPHFVEFCSALDVFKAGKLTSESRYPIAQIVGTHVDVVVTHHWENGLNYLYYDLLYLGYPLVHNSEFIRDAGYYYPAFDTQAGGQILLQALLEHDGQMNDYRERAQRVWWRASIDNPEIVAEHERLLWALFDPSTPTRSQRATRDHYTLEPSWMGTP
jgi:hypothetical protein